MNKATILSELNYRTIINTVPAALFILDNEARILDINTNATELTNQESDVTLRKLCGDVLHCFHAQNAPKGCGTTEYCPDCIIRSSVLASCQGNIIVKKKAELLVQKGQTTQARVFLISASPFTHKGETLSILSMEDITELMLLKKFIPICSACKKIRNDDDYWESIERFLKEQYGAQMSHGICPDCIKKLYPDLDIPPPKKSP